MFASFYDYLVLINYHTSIITLNLKVQFYSKFKQIFKYKKLGSLEKTQFFLLQLMQLQEFGAITHNVILKFLKYI